MTNTATILEFSGRQLVQHAKRIDMAGESAAYTAAIGRIAQQTHRSGPTLPWPKTHEAVRLKRGEVSLWAGWPGHGKTALVNWVALGLLRQGVEVFTVSLEMPAERVIAQLYRQMAADECPTERWMTAAADWLRSSGYRIANAGDLVTPGEVLEAVESYLMGDIDRHVIIDNVSFLDLPEEHGAQEAARAFMLGLVHLARQFSGHIHLVCHLRKGRSDVERPSYQDVAGSRHYIGLADNIFVAWRNRRKEVAMALPPDVVDGMKPAEAQAHQRLLTAPDTHLLVEKNRDLGWLGVVGLWFDPASQQFLAGPDHRPLAMDEVRA